MGMRWLVAGALLAALNACGSKSGATDEGAGGADAEGSRPEPELELSCRKFCGILIWAADECAPGTEAIHGELLEAGEAPTTEAPLSDDQACIDSCTTYTGGGACWQIDARSNTCLASARWQCADDRAWGTSDCTDFGDDDSLCTE